MKRVATADSLFMATLWMRMLEDAGIKCELRNQFAPAASFMLPPTDVFPEVWLKNDRDYDAAASFLRELRKTSETPDWQCPRCAQSIEAQFAQCWNCQAMKPELS